MLFKISDFTPAKICKLTVSLILPLALYFFMPRGEPLTEQMIAFLAVTLWAVCAWAMSLLNNIAVSLLLPIFYMLFCHISHTVVYKPWLGAVPYIVISGFIIAKVMESTGLGRRLALRCVLAAGGSFSGAMWGITLGAVIMTPFVPPAMGRAAIFCAIAMCLCNALGFKPGGREATATVLIAALAVSSSKLGYLTGGADLVMGMGLADSAMQAQTSWLEYARYNFLPSLLYTAMSVGLALAVLRPAPHTHDLCAIVRDKYKALGPITRDEKLAALLLLLCVILLATIKIHGIGAEVVMMFVAAAAFLPGICLMDGKKLAEINFAPLFFITGCMAIGSVGEFLRVSDWLANIISPFFSHSSVYAASMAAYATGVILDFLLTPFAAISTTTGAIIGLGMDMGCNPLFLYFSFQYGLDNLIFPYEYVIYLYFFSSGYISLRLMMLVMGIRIFLAAAFVAAIALPYWKIIS